MWKYEVSNTDHALMQGVEWVNHLFLGEPETTIGLRYEATRDGLSGAVHERARVAGSGEKRLAQAGTDSSPTPGDIDEAHLSEEELGITNRP